MNGDCASLRQPPRDLGLADAGRPDHQDVLRRDLLGQVRRAASAGACGCAARSPRRAWPSPGRRRICRARRRSARRQRLDRRSWRRSGKIDGHAVRYHSSSIVRCRVRVDADLGGDRHRLLGDRARSSVVCCASAFAAASAYAPPDPIPMMPSSGSIRSPVPESRNVDLIVHDDQHRLEPAQHAVGAPVLGQLDRRALEVAAILLQLRLEPREQRERVGRRAGEAGQDLVVVEPADLAGACLTTVSPSVTWPSPA